MGNFKRTNMKSIYLSIGLLFVTIFSFSQEIPVIKAEDSNLGLKELSIKVEVVGNIATTTYDMLFYNTHDRILEGELSFPLGENQNVTRFALDLNGTLREAVVVEKELGRVAYESTIRQKIDPALLEQTKGNNYKARIYPIPAKGTKRVVLSYQQELINKEEAHFYHLPLNFEDELARFKLDFVVFEQTIIPIIKTDSNEKLTFDKWDHNYKFTINRNNYIANKGIDIQIPIRVEDQKLITNKDTFYFYTNITPSTKLKVKPTKIMLLWDVSLSMKNRDITKELAVLENYLKYLSTVEITVKKFSNEFIEEKKFSIKQGKSEQVQGYLKNSIYDGATSYKDIFSMGNKYNECLLFTDGMDNLGVFNTIKKTPIYIVNSIVTSNHNVLKNVGIQSGGNYINLNTLSNKQANDLLINETFRFLGVHQKSKNKIEIYPNSITNITSDFSISGKNFENNDTVELLFGYANKVTKRLTIYLQKATHKNELINKIWAQKKLASLVINKEENRMQIIGLSKEHQLISPYTSLIVLDRVEDYVRYRIEPPKELQVAYKRLLKAQEDEDEFLDAQEITAELLKEYEDINDWWNTKFKKKKPKKEKRKKKPVAVRTPESQPVVTTPEPQPDVSNTTITSDTTNTNTVTITSQVINPNLRIVSGIVSDEMGPIVDISVVIKGTAKGTTTDFDGKFTVNANTGDVLKFSHISYSDKEITVGESNTVNVMLEESGNTLEEVVIMANAPLRVREISYSSVSNVRSESVTTDIVTSLAGKVAGLNIEPDRGQPGSSSKIQIRGLNTMITNKPLYIIDGVLYEKNIDLETTEIAEISILKGNNATAIYGARASNGVIIITTKKGLQNKGEQITAFNTMVDGKLAMKGWDPNTSYIEKINAGKTLEERYAIYLKIRENYKKQPTFYIDVSDYFMKENQAIAIRILSNIAEIDINNYELLRAIAYKFEAIGKYEQALYLYKELLKIRPEDIQSYRDLALCYQAVGKYQKALDLFYKIVNGSLVLKDEERRFEGIEAVAYVEMNHLISKFKKTLDLSKIDKKLIKPITTDVRVVIDWNHNDTDIDLWVFDPNNEKCYYSHTKTEIGGIISEDMTEGFGPEEFMLKKAIKGQYRIKAKYYNDNVQKISGPTILKVTVFRNYGKRNETKKVTVFKLDKESEEVIEIGRLKV